MLNCEIDIVVKRENVLEAKKYAVSKGYDAEYLASYLHTIANNECNGTVRLAIGYDGDLAILGENKNNSVSFRDDLPERESFMNDIIESGGVKLEES